jgi:hypothetical protein
MNTNLAEIEKSFVADEADPPAESDMYDFIDGPMNRPNYDLYAVRVLSEQAISPTEIQLEVQARLDPSQGLSRTWTLRKVGAEWRLVVFYTRDENGNVTKIDIGLRPPSQSQ